MRAGQNSAPTSTKGIVVYGKLGTMPQSFRLYRRYSLRVLQRVVWREPVHGSKWHIGRVTNRDPLRIE